MEESINLLEKSRHDITSIVSTDLVKRQSSISWAIIIFCTLVSDTGRGILLPTLWLFVEYLGGDRSQLGLAVGAYSAGRIISSPILGRYSELFGHRIVLSACNIIVAVGCLVYVASSSVWMIILAQWIIGLGAGSLGVTRSFVAERTTTAERTVYMAYISAVQYAGFTVTPIIGALLTMTTSTGELLYYILPSMVLFCSAALCTILLLTAFHDDRHCNYPETVVVKTETFINERVELASMDTDSLHTTTEQVKSAESHENFTTKVESSEYYQKSTAVVSFQADFNSTVMWLLVASCLLNIATKGSIAVFETLSVEYAERQYEWTATTTGFTIAGFGVLGFSLLLNFSYLLMLMSDSGLLQFGMILMTVSCLNLVIFAESKQSTAFYASLLLMYGIGYPVGHTALLGIYSKLGKNHPQGEMLGYFASAGSFARILFPILAGILSDSVGDYAIFATMGVVLLLSLVLFSSFKSLFINLTK